MNLSDLLVTYNLVKAPIDEISKEADLPNPNASKFDRFINYLKTKKEEEDKSSSTPSLKTSEQQGFPGWYQGVNDEGKASEPIDVSLPQPTSTKFWGDGDFDFDTEYTKAKGKYKTLSATMSSLEGSQNKNEFTKNLNKFLATEAGAKYNPANYANDPIMQQLVQEDINTLYKIAALESSYDATAESNETKSKDQRAVGYFLLLGKVLRDQKYNYDDVKKDVNLLFKIAFERLEEAKKQLQTWGQYWDRSGIFAKTTDFLRIYAHWWCPDITLRFFRKNWTDKDKEVIGQTIGKINIVEILARAREQ